MKKIWKKVVVLVLVVLVCGLVGCGKFVENVGADVKVDVLKAGSKGVIGVLVMILINSFFKVIGDFIKEEVVKYGYEVIVTSGEKDVFK